MADSYNLLDNLMSLFSPKTAEAKVVSHSPQVNNIQNSISQKTGEIDPFTQLLYKTILTHAERVPQEYQVKGETLPTMSLDTLAAYTPETRTVSLRPDSYFMDNPKNPRAQEVFIHELLHGLVYDFIQGQSKQVRPALSEAPREHKLIDYFLGGGDKPLTPDKYYNWPFGFPIQDKPDLTRKFINEVFHGSPLSQGVVQSK